MTELFKRLAKNPAKTLVLLLVSLVANILALASSVFVMLVLGRYVSYGVDATLFTLTAGVVIAVVMEFAFRQLRLRLIRTFNDRAEFALSIGAFGVLANSQIEQLERLPPETRFQLPRHLETVSSAFSASNISAILDVPFALLFVFALFLLQPVLGFIALGFTAAIFPVRWLGRWLMQRHSKALEEANLDKTRLFNDVVRSPDSARVFDLSGQLTTSWTETAEKTTISRAEMMQSQGSLEIFVASFQILLGVVIIAVGALYVVAGELQVGALIGANILAARAFAPVSKLAQLTPLFSRASGALMHLRKMAEMPIEGGINSPVEPARGQFEFREVSFSHKGMPAPLFEKLNLLLPAGAFLLIKGANGTGKTTFQRMVLGLLNPDHGQILADGIETRQLDQGWWRSQISYLPQEPFFFDGSIRSNLQAANSELGDAQLMKILEDAGLKEFVEQDVFGLDFLLTGGGANLAVGVRKRLALARALVRNTPIVIFDEPTEGLDTDGRARMGAIIDWLSRKGRTIILASEDPAISEKAEYILDLDYKPIPTVTISKNVQSLAEIAQ